MPLPDDLHPSEQLLPGQAVIRDGITGREGLSFRFTGGPTYAATATPCHHIQGRIRLRSPCCFPVFPAVP